MSYRADKQVIDTHTHIHTHTDRYTDRGDDNTRRPKLASGKKRHMKYRVETIVLFHNGFSLAVSTLTSKTVCIYFPGKRRYRENPPTLYMSDKALSWVKSVKHLGNIVT